ncbi:MAG: hypothetical protein WCA07_08510 [Gloeobacterales cyanobacterium]
MLIGSILPVLPAWADGTAAGTTISNTATATYSDNAGTPQPPATSNTVTVTVAEVAGITVTAAGVTPAIAGPITPGSIVYYDYVVTNIGNDNTRFTIPNLATVTSGPGSVNGNLLIDLSGGSTFATTITTGSYTTTDIPVGGTIKVRVPILVNGTATSGQQITVKLGNTPGEAQNQQRTAVTSQAEDIFTVDGPDSPLTGEAVGAPINGVREASASQVATIGSTPQAFAAILKTSAYTYNSSQPLNQQTITYNLSLRVDSAAPVGSTGYSASTLSGTPINVDGISQTTILVSDAIPANTVLTGTPVAPSGWTAVYTTDLTSTPSNTAQWKTFPSSGTVTRVGFIYGSPTPIDPGASGTTVSGFSFVVTTTGATGGASIRNLAQVFGTTTGSTTLVYDESGDQNPSNFTDGPNPVSDPFDSVTNTGVASATDGTDPGNNTGTGSDGEDNVVVVGTPSTLVNGPLGAPTAIGPTSNNDDFSNKAAQLGGTSNDNPNPVAFGNTVQNSGSSSTDVSLVPGAAPALPDNTEVTISFGGQSATYTYTAGVPTLTTGVAVVIPALPAGGTANYGVSIDVPGSVTPTSAQTGTTVITEFTVPIVASSGTNQNTTLDRVYVGFMTLAKTARVLAADGVTELKAAGTALTGDIPPGSIIEYVVTYKNISDAQAGSGNNLVLNAQNLVINEDGTLAGNNWALDNAPTNGVIDTSHVLGNAQDSSGGTITYYSGATLLTSEQSGTTAANDVTKYVDTVIGPIGPQTSKTFTFRRRIN